MQASQFSAQPMSTRASLSTVQAARSLVFLALFSCFTLTGCEDKPELPKEDPADLKPLAERQFDHIMQDIKRVVESKDPLRSETMPTVGGAGAEWRTTVTHDLIKPENESDPYRAVIHVNTVSTITVIKIDQPDFEEKSKANDKQSETATEGLEGIEQLGEASPGLNIPSSPIKTFDNSQSRDYEMIHENGRWRLLTELDPDTERTIEFAFSAAISRQ